MLYAHLSEGAVVTEAQRRVILSAIALKGMSQGAFATEAGVNLSDLNRTINGRLVVTERTAAVLNGVVGAMHPVQVERQAA